MVNAQSKWQMGVTIVMVLAPTISAGRCCWSAAYLRCYRYSYRLQLCLVAASGTVVRGRGAGAPYMFSVVLIRR